ncbi:unnamed protein product [Tetraodon nigroviridis]|uniref:(spotted green pufferfish) hypothetical protein n=1 Tax=Tetraodon nigroviridis TaxID=99883 RepID=Q4SV31_TETNG|nr:unnamed protein product [Tetraodon nigroviridis]
MHAKYALALILVLQVSLSLCEVPEPTQELVDKYSALKAKFYTRIARLRLLEKVQDLIEQSEAALAAKTLLGSVEPNPRLQAAEKFTKALGAEIEPIVDQARIGLLGVYEHYLRPYIGKALDDGITAAQPVLDAIMPAE